MMLVLPKQIHWWRVDARRGLTLKNILKWCREKRKTDRLLLSVRPIVGDVAKIDHDVEVRVSELFGENILTNFKAMGWPGNLLMKDFAHIYIVNFNEKIEKKIIAVESNLFNWRHGHHLRLPEDLCLFREGSNYPNFLSVTHEKDAWLLSETEKSPFPGLKAEKMEKSFIFDGPWFCSVKE